MAMIQDILKFLIPLLVKCIQQIASLARTESPNMQEAGMYSPRRTPRFNMMDDDDMLFRDNLSSMSSSPRFNKRSMSPIFGGDASVGFAGVDSSVHQSNMNDSMISDVLDEDFIETRPKRNLRRKTTTKVEKKQTRQTIRESPRIAESFCEEESVQTIKESPIETPEPEKPKPKKGVLGAILTAVIISFMLSMTVYMIFKMVCRISQNGNSQLLKCTIVFPTTLYIHRANTHTQIGHK